MADGTVVVGVVGILTSGVAAPLIQYHISRDKDRRQTITDLADECLGTVAAMTHAWTDLTSFRFRLSYPREEEAIAAAKLDAVMAEARTLRLRLFVRLPPDHAFVTVYGAILDEWHSFERYANAITADMSRDEQLEIAAASAMQRTQELYGVLYHETRKLLEDL
jgi:hypothetical protein